MNNNNLKRLNEEYVTKRLMVGDVIVSLGTSWIANFIARITQGASGRRSCNHVGIVSKDYDGNLCVIEALAEGITQKTLEWHWKHCKRWLICRYKLAGQMDFQEIDFFRIIRKFMGGRYAFKQLFQDFRALLLQIGVGKAEAYYRLVSSADPAGFTCTEFVGSVYQWMDVNVDEIIPVRYLTANNFLESLMFDTIYTSEDER